jgi:RNA polymerase sigma-70 factor (ECF subfamily)
MKAGETASIELAGSWPVSGEAEVLAGLCEGSERAFDWLISRYQASVYNLVYQIIEDRNNASDTVQEVFLKVFRGIREFRGQCSLKTWIYRIAVHEASNQRRWWSRHRRRELSLETPLSLANEEGDERTLGSTLVDERESPYDSTANVELQEVVQRALAEIPPPFRAVIVLRDVEDLSYEEIAEVLQLRVGTVKSRLARGREALRPMLAEYLEQRQTPRDMERVKAASPK